MITSYAITDIGLRRQLNEDSIFATDYPLGNLPNVYVVADGMGGHNAGDLASKMTIETVVEQIEHSFEKNPVLILKQAIRSANHKVMQTARAQSELDGMGTTIVACTCMGKYLQIANIGDSRLYVLRDKLEQITVDHSLVEEMIKMGGIDRKNARNHPKKNVITRAIGAFDEVEADFFHVELNKGDLVMLCSDGLNNMVEDDVIEQILKESLSLKDKAERLVALANENGGKDNISIILVDPFTESEAC